MHPFVKALQEHFTAHQNPEKAEPMARYMKNHFLFRYSNTGKTPIIKRHHSNTYSPGSKRLPNYHT